MVTDPEPPSPYNFVVCGAFVYPAGDASANRMLQLAQLAANSGHRTLVINDAAPPSHDPSLAKGTYGGIDYVCIDTPTRGVLGRLLRRWSRPGRLAAAIKLFCGNSEGIIVSLPTGLFGILAHVRLQRMLGVKVVCDVVERHDPHQFRRRRAAPAFIRHRWTSWTAQYLSDGCIVISTELEKRFSQSRHVIRVPALVDVGEFPTSTDPRSSHTLTLLYSGNPVNKDQLGALIDVLISESEVNNGLRPVQLRLAGPDVRALAANPDVGSERVQRFGKVIVPLGRLSREKLKEELRDANFTVLFRRNHGYARAGFPSKVAESLAAGTPVLANLSSDLGLYLMDERNAVICRSVPTTGEVDADDLAKRLTALRAKTDEELLAMQIAARDSAEMLSIARWSRPFEDWLDSL